MAWESKVRKATHGTLSGGIFVRPWERKRKSHKLSEKIAIQKRRTISDGNNIVKMHEKERERIGRKRIKSQNKVWDDK